LEFIEGFFDAEGCVKIIKDEVRKTLKICLDFTNFENLGLMRGLLKDVLEIEARFSVTKPKIGKDKSKRKTVYNLRIYKKDFGRKFFERINTTKLIPEKIQYIENLLGLNN